MEIRGLQLDGYDDNTSVYNAAKAALYDEPYGYRVMTNEEKMLALAWIIRPCVLGEKTKKNWREGICEVLNKGYRGPFTLS